MLRSCAGLFFKGEKKSMKISALRVISKWTSIGAAKLNYHERRSMDPNSEEAKLLFEKVLQQLFGHRTEKERQAARRAKTQNILFSCATLSELRRLITQDMKKRAEHNEPEEVAAADFRGTDRTVIRHMILNDANSMRSGLATNEGSDNRVKILYAISETYFGECFVAVHSLARQMRFEFPCRSSMGVFRTGYCARFDQISSICFRQKLAIVKLSHPLTNDCCVMLNAGRMHPSELPKDVDVTCGKYKTEREVVVHYDRLEDVFHWTCYLLNADRPFFEGIITYSLEDEQHDRFPSPPADHRSRHATGIVYIEQLPYTDSDNSAFSGYTGTYAERPEKPTLSVREVGLFRHCGKMFDVVLEAVL
ncbi:unnamed protein product [Gongylonema pulchrum]|uniref:DUF2263 domain-containing protein n=1 Tax=Gongylonema pulchrum TaxID=637853 RepID=A0A183DRJ3_9BILA|nr:unnamed protein product [Gongylonema pulchrum]